MQGPLEFISSQIGQGKRFATKRKLVEFLALPRTRQAKLYKFLNGADTQYKTVAEWVAALGGAIDGAREFICRPGPHAPPDVVGGQGLKTIPVYQKAGAGPGAADLDEMEPLFYISVPPEYFKRSDFAVLVDGHSMEPTIMHRSVVGAQRHFDFKANELYVARIPYEGLVVKRVAVGRDGRAFVFKSDNKDKDNYPDYEINMTEAETIVMGRVVWIMYRY
ncbi:MAG: S24 family peptidase [Desulfovibrio sp.]|nr:S24 family peptidase [Desulfovibrio sp.]